MLHLRGLTAIVYKEFIHIRHDGMAILFALLMPLLEMTLLGGAVDTNVRQIPTVVYDQSGNAMQSSADSRVLLDRLRNTDTFHILALVHSMQELNEALITGQARVGIMIPYDYAHHLLDGNTTQVLVLVDGSDSAVAGQAVNVAAQVGLRESLARQLPDAERLVIDIRPQIMFNPDSRSPNFLLPGMIAILLLFVTTMLTAFSVVREKENGTIEQLLVTPVQPLALLLGKIIPYFILGVVELCVILFFMHYLFLVPIHGNVLLLITLSTGYLFVNLTIGILVSTQAASQAEAMQLALINVLPSAFLSGYLFPRDTMPLLFQYLSDIIPTTYMVNITRGVILRGAGWPELWPDALLLFALGVGVLLLAARRFTHMIV